MADSNGKRGSRNRDSDSKDSSDFNEKRGQKRHPSKGDALPVVDTHPPPKPQRETPESD